MAATLPRPAVLPHSGGCQSCSASDRLSLQIISSSSAASKTSGNNTSTAGSFASSTPTNNPPTPSGAKSRPPPLSPHKQKQQQHADSNMSQSVILAHSRELEPHRPVSTSMQDITWCPMQESSQYEDDVTTSSPELLVAVWPTTTMTTTSPSTDGRSRQPTQSISISESVETPFIHIPRCKLSVTNFDDIHQPLPAAGRGGPYPGHGSIKIEQVALPRAVVQQFLSGVRLPNGIAGMDVDVAFPRHFDDADEWVQSRCILSDFSELDEEEAAQLSSEERLCCWGSIVLTRDGDNGWDLGFVMHRVLTQRDPVSGTCGCGRR
ncbi:hypothetical protein SMACR_01433 [Sordaria macrospora]|uniref:WGS project CABT00000000 data, contig 2.4 n=2 Tax=Sordaria macrospora TaxID=5147 RepID=F7VQT6_SORMK|nr:uncharacterized protein SMAC_01433 [Sordaria macrospora k-hell]KAA8633051.1 hypothetical protein SMACR_01433 [Sordaria macrospora]KAH7634522.1 hypothetical protein B0T09DRAFT_7123 [Sordaria sp. MPI-SDFR-AT-0083]WPJ58688.1 hypothetical protein SMAC4_01433 [Sordaria macrospora]CCC07868.1 unnamed protein product [Sordaria macrospora k-hell]